MDLRKNFTDYQKGGKAIFADLEARIDQAITHSVRLAKHNEDTGAINPATEMHELVKYLRALKTK
jgi:hypothetical protein